MVSVNNLSLYFGGQDIFKDISFMVNKGDKIGLTGKNGAGKSTLLKVLAKDLTPNKGNVSVPNGLIVGFLRQDLEFEDGRTVLEEAQTAFEFLNDVEKRMNEANKQLTERTDYESDAYLDIINEFNELEERFRMAGGNDTAAEINQVLSGLGFTQYDFERQTTEFSGGWRMRIELAKILLMKPDLLLLDEPTNHLDMATVELLAEALTKYDGSIILVSHDRYFISKTANKIWEIEDEQIIEFKGDYTEWVEWKERMAKQKAANPEAPKQAPKQVEKKVEPVAAEVKAGPIDKEHQKLVQKLQKQIAQIEQNLETLNTEKAAIELEMANPAIYADPAKFHIVEKSYQDKNALIKSINKEYEVAFNDLLQLESK